MLSMTGFGSARVEIDRGDAEAAVFVEARAVNHRYLDVRVRAPARLLDHASAVEEAARKRLARGRIEIALRLDGSMPGAVQLDRERARAAYSALKDLRDELAPAEAVPLTLLASVPDLFVADGDQDRTALRDVVLRAAEAACDDLSQMRAREGAAHAADRHARLKTVNALTADIGPRTEVVVEEYRERLKGRLTRLMQGSDVELDDSRLEHEVALQADRADISEELTRLSSHTEQFGDLVGAGDDPVGRKLDFLLQEMGREVNTIGSKVGDVQITRSVLDLKAELERLREQVQNVL